MLDRSYRIESVNGTAPCDGSPLFVLCNKKVGLTVYTSKGFSRKTVMHLDPVRAKVYKVGHGPYGTWTGRSLGLWEVGIHDSIGLTYFRMRNEGDARHLAKWVERYAKRKGGS